MSDPIDLVRLREFSDGTPEGVRQLCDMFVSHMTEGTAALRPAVADGRADDIKAQAHKIAGTAGACGAGRLSALTSRMEALGADGQLAGTAPLMEEIDAELRSIRTFLLDAGLIPAAPDAAENIAAADSPDANPDPRR